MQPLFKFIVMDDDDRFYTLEEQVHDDDAEQGEKFPLETCVPLGAPADDFVDELQALNTSLCFLCSINADSSVVDHFLKRFPEALLLEGACLLPEDSAQYILEQHMRRCTCRGRCHENRQQVSQRVQRGFEWYQAHRTDSTVSAQRAWAPHFHKLVRSEATIRQHRRQELLLRNAVIEAGMEFKAYKEELERVRAKNDGKGSRTQSPLALLACSRNRSSLSLSNWQSQVSVLEYQVRVASVNLRRVERERNYLLERIRDDRQSQFHVLKKAFEGCRRHDICSIGYIVPREPPTQGGNQIDS